MLGKLWKAAAVSLALILTSSVTVGAVTVNFGTAAAVATDNIQNWPAAPATVSETAVLIDADTGAVLYDKGMDEYRFPASTTKLMTLLVAVENASPRAQVTFTETGVRDVTWDSSNIGMQLGETITMKDCWYAAIIESANEVCAQIAETVGGTERAGLYENSFCQCRRPSGRQPLYNRTRSGEDHACWTAERQIPQSGGSGKLYDPGHKYERCQRNAHPYAPDGERVKSLL